MLVKAVVLVLLSHTSAALAAEGGVRGPAVLDDPLNGSTLAGSGEAASMAAAALSTTDVVWFDEGPEAVSTMWNMNVSDSMDPEASTEMLYENSSFTENRENASLGVTSQRRRQHHHQHHHHHDQHHDHHSDHHSDHRVGKVLVLFHQTSPEAGPAILHSGFRPGRQGWCGGGIYFATSPGATYHKAIGPDSHKGYIIGAKVDVGRVKYMGKTCDRSMNGGTLQKWGYDSIHFNPGDGVEYVVYSKSRIISMWHHKR